MSKVAAIFDLDGTLSRGHIWEGFRRYYTNYKKRRLPSMFAFLTTHMALWLLAKCRLLSKEKCWLKWTEDLNGAFKGLSREEVQKMSRWVINEYILKLSREDVVNILDEHKQSGHIVVIVSAAFSEFLEIVGQELGVPYVIGTKLEVVDDKYTGKSIKPLCFGENKARLLKEFIDQNELEIDLSSSFAYADSIFDVPLLKLVGIPVATYPGKDFRQFAELNGWQILPL
jgi:HAD superfamily hydrolase (TIGR01490 family)